MNDAEVKKVVNKVEQYEKEIRELKSEILIYKTVNRLLLETIQVYNSRGIVE